MDAADLAKMPAAQQEVWRAMPIWAKSAYAVAVWVGLSGAIALLMRQRWARECFAVSLLAVLVQFGWAYLGTTAMRALGLVGAAFPILIIVAAAFLFWFAGWAARRGWLRERIIAPPRAGPERRRSSPGRNRCRRPCAHRHR
jgi:hypothetical protein